MLEPLIEAVSRYMIPVLVFVALVLHMVFKSMIDLARTIGQERTRREIAAYVASGKMSPQDAERLMPPGEPPASA